MAGGGVGWQLESLLLVNALSILPPWFVVVLFERARPSPLSAALCR